MCKSVSVTGYFSQFVQRQHTNLFTDLKNNFLNICGGLIHTDNLRDYFSLAGAAILIFNTELIFFSCK